MELSVVLVFVGIALSVLGLVYFSRVRSRFGLGKDTHASTHAPSGVGEDTHAGAGVGEDARAVTDISAGDLGQVEGDFSGSRSVGVALENTKKGFFGRIKGLFSSQEMLSNFDDLEEILYTSDLGPKTVTRLMGKLSELSRSEKTNFDGLKIFLRAEFDSILSGAGASGGVSSEPLEFLNGKMTDAPLVVMVVGVNGAGKTTSIGKMAAHLAKSGKKVLVAAGDTFRAAAGAQLKVWTDRAAVDIFSPDKVLDPSAVAFDAVSKAKAGGYDVVLIDTAGRLHTQANLMEELKKVKRVMTKVIPEAPHEVLIVLDANSGQNALHQAKEFHAALGLTGVVLTKMDGTAKGGVAVGLSHELGVPIRLIGVGEKIGDLRAFSRTEFIDSILGGE
jgi:fused signal recognition particle receptor